MEYRPFSPYGPNTIPDLYIPPVTGGAPWPVTQERLITALPGASVQPRVVQQQQPPWYSGQLQYPYPSPQWPYPSPQWPRPHLESAQGQLTPTMHFLSQQPALPIDSQTSHEVHTQLNQLENTHALNIRCTVGEKRDRMIQILKGEVGKILENTLTLNIEEQMYIFMRVAILWQESGHFESAVHYLLACSGLTSIRSNDDQAKTISTFINCSHTLPQPIRYGQSQKPPLETHFTRTVNTVKLQAMVLLAWNNSKRFLEQLKKEENEQSVKTASDSAASKTSSVLQLYQWLEKELNYVNTILHQWPITLAPYYDLKLKEAMCTKRNYEGDFFPVPLNRPRQDT